jgi:hypothetical protein
MKTFPVILFVFLLSMLVVKNDVFSQKEEPEGYDSIAETILLRKEMTGGITIHNLGMGINFRKGVNKTFFNSRIFEVEIVSMKHPKQIRVINPYYYNAKSYVYGKLNHVYILRASFGFKKLLNRKPYWGGIELRAVYLGGISIAFAKPVYLYFWDALTNTVDKQPKKYDPDNPFQNSDYIYGRAPFSYGLGEIRVYPGLYAKAGLNFEFGTLSSKMRALEAGAVIEYFPSAIPIMAFNPPENLLITFYLNFSLGKRYNSK